MHPAQEWLETLKSIGRCRWCGVDSKPLNRAGLCGYCVRTKDYIAKVQRDTDALQPTASRHEQWKQERELQIARNMVELCKEDGEQMEYILNGDSFNVFELESTFDEVAYRICHSHLYKLDIATYLGSSFTTVQKRILAYLLWRPILADHKRKRMRMASRRQLQQIWKRNPSTT